MPALMCSGSQEAGLAEAGSSIYPTLAVSFLRHFLWTFSKRDGELEDLLTNSLKLIRKLLRRFCILV